ncbi:MAG: hypothetical protein ACTSQG_03440, partial [Promethearchaeota archaeon]
MENGQEILKKKEEISQERGKLGLKESIQPLSQRKKLILIIIFIFGIAFSYPTVLPLGLLCAAILLFQKNKKV